jgi:hypothetical protein
LTFTIVFTVDVDQDGMTVENERNALSWESVEQVIPIGGVFAARALPVTWFVRADNQMAEIYGSVAYLLDEYRELWSSLRARGDEIAWHPHLYERNAAGVFESDLDDERCASKLRDTHAELAAQGLEFASVRIGEAFHGNSMMRTLSNLGLQVDSTAIPGRRRHDHARFFDWEPTPTQPYRPSASDYRVGGDDALPIVELPMTMVTIKADYDPKPLPRYLSLAYRPSILREALDRHLATACDDAVIVTILHPEEVRPSRATAHPLYANSLDAVEENLETLLRATREQAQVQAVTASSFGTRAAVQEML